MKFDISNTSNAHLIADYESFTFDEVLQTMESSQRIVITTFNFDLRERLYQKLLSLGKNQEVLVITSLPNRFEEYKSENARRRAKLTIDNYLKSLNPKNFQCQFKPHFLFNNHAKIIATDTTAYFGSQNYSSASYNNFECGLVINQNTESHRFISRIINEMLTLSVAYPGTDKSRFNVLLARLLDSSKKLQEQVRGWYKETEIYKNTTTETPSLPNIAETPLSLESIENFAWEIKETLTEMADHYERAAEALNPEIPATLVYLVERLQPAFNFDADQYANARYLDKHPAPDDAEQILSDCHEEALDRQHDLETSVEQLVPQVALCIELLCEMLTQALRVLADCPIHDQGIDNT